MKKTIHSIILTATIAASVIALPTQAAVVDQIRNKVDAIKDETKLIKSKSNVIQTRVEEMSSTLNAQIMETIDIRNALDPLFKVKEMLDPTELMEMVDFNDLKDKIAKMKAQKAENIAMLQDPNLEDFRQELLDMFRGLNQIIADDRSLIEASPMETMIEKAPPIVIALFKKVSGTLLAPLVQDIQETISITNQLEQLGVTDFVMALDNISPNQFAFNHPKPPVNGTMNTGYKSQAIDMVCRSAAAGVTGPFWILAHRKVGRLQKAKNKIELILSNVEALQAKIPPAPAPGVHGYVEIKLPLLSSVRRFQNKTQSLKLQGQIEKWLGIRDLVRVVGSGAMNICVEAT